jgi:hypothetical protein
VHKVLKRRGIKNTDEYYIIKETVIDQAKDFTEEDKVLLNRYLEAFDLLQEKK